MAAARKVVTIDVVSRHLEKALAAAPKNVDYRVKWRPFFLSPASMWQQYGPEAAVKGVNKKAFYDAKFGKDKWKSFMPRLSQAFRDAGCGEISMEGNTGPTLDSHRLITFAARHNKQDELIEELFRNYFLESKTICDPEVLLAAAEKVQLPDAAALLADPSAMMTEVNDELQFAKGVSGVPFFIFNVEGEKRRALTLSGAQPPDLLLEAIEEMAQ